jgi:hypothetical protein
VAYFAQREEPQMRIYDMKMLEDAWRPLPNSGCDIDQRSAVKLERYPHVVLPLPTDNPHIEMTVAGTSVHESPVKAGTYKLGMYIIDDDGRVFWYTCLATINTPDGHPKLAYVSSGRALDGLQQPIRQTSYAGYVLDDRNWLGNPRSLDGTAIFLHGQGKMQPDLSSYSGVITRVTKSGVVLSYYT